MSRNTLRTLSLLYLLIPNLLFVLAWFRTSVGSIAATGLLIAACLNVRGIKNKEPLEYIKKRELVFLVLSGLFLTAISGVDGYFYQNIDYWAHNSKYYTLFNHSWPVIFQENLQYACHYFGFFLVPALISKFLGEISGTALLVWAAAGYWLALCWIYIISNKSAVSLCLFFILGSAGHFIKMLWFKMAGLADMSLPFVTEIWPVLYQSMLAINQAVPAIIVASVLYNDFRIDRRPERSFLFITLNFIFGIFPTITLGLIYLLMCATHFKADPKLIFTKENLPHLLIPAIAVVPTFIYFLSGGSTVITGFIWQFDRFDEISVHYFFGIVIEIGLLVLLAFLLRLHKDKDRMILLGIIFLLLIISTYRIGKWNDWFMKGNMPLVMLLLLFIINKCSLWMNKVRLLRSRATLYAVYSIMVVSSVIPALHILRALKHNIIVQRFSSEKQVSGGYPYDHFHDFFEMGKVIYSMEEANQFLGAKGSVYELYLARPVK